MFVLSLFTLDGLTFWSEYKRNGEDVS
jgi:hypothetical protein